MELPDVIALLGVFFDRHVVNDEDENDDDDEKQRNQYQCDIGTSRAEQGISYAQCSPKPLALRYERQWRQFMADDPP